MTVMMIMMMLLMMMIMIINDNTDADNSDSKAVPNLYTLFIQQHKHSILWCITYVCSDLVECWYVSIDYKSYPVVSMHHFKIPILVHHPPSTKLMSMMMNMMMMSMSLVLNISRLDLWWDPTAQRLHIKSRIYIEADAGRPCQPSCHHAGRATAGGQQPTCIVLYGGLPDAPIRATYHDGWCEEIDAQPHPTATAVIKKDENDDDDIDENDDDGWRWGWW